MRGVRGGLGCVVVLAMTWWLPSAAGAVELERVGAMAERAGSGEAHNNQRLAVDHSSGEVLLADTAGDRVAVFSPDGTELGAVGAGELSDPFGVAVDQADGDLYVADAGNDRILRYERGALGAYTLDITFPSPVQGTATPDTAAGEVGSFAAALAVDPSNGDLLVADPGNNLVSRYSSAGDFVSAFDGSGSPGGAFTGLLDLAVNSSGDVFVVDSTGDVAQQQGTSRVERFAADGSHQQTIGPVDMAATVTVRPASDEIVISGGQDAVHRNSVASLHTFTSAGDPAGQVDLDSSVIYSRVTGMAFDDSDSDRLYVATDVGHYGADYQYGNPSIQIYQAFAAAELTDPVVADVGGTQADVTATIDPNGVAREWLLEVSTDAGANWVSAAQGTTDAGDDPVAIAATLTDLDARSDYLVRLRVPASGVSSAEVAFQTLGAPPRVRADRPKADAATWKLRGAVDPQGADTSYWFEYGPTTDYGSRVPASIDAPAGDGNAFVTVTQEVDLAPGTYHYRLVARNDDGTAATPDRHFEAVREGQRAYELVTPVGDEPRVLYGGGPATPDGNMVCFNSEWAIAGSTPNGVVTAADGYCARRTATGWETEWVTGPAPAESTASAGSQVYFVSPDGARAVYASDAGLYPDYPGGAPGDGASYANKTALMWEGGAMPRWLAPSPLREEEVRPQVGGAFDWFIAGSIVDREPVAVSDDLRHGVFYSSGQLIPEDQNSELDVYEWTPDGIRLVSRDASGQAAGGTVPFGVSLPTQQPAHDQTLAQPGTMTRDGSRIFFQHVGALDGEGADGVTNVFRREGDDVVHVSPRRGPAGPALDVFFMGASTDGEVVYLASEQQLTSEPVQAGVSLYRYDVVGDGLELVASAAAGVRFLDVSADGSTVVYATGVDGPDGQLWVDRGGATSLVGTLGAMDAAYAIGGVSMLEYGRRALRVAPDGSQVVFASTGTYPGSAGGGSMQVYRWTPDGTVERISAVDTSSPAAGDASIGNYSVPHPLSPRFEATNRIRQFPNLGRVLTDDGRIFFETPERLVPRDQNAFVDVYEWRDGEVALVTPGTLKDHALYHDSSADGSTVFFTTYARVIPELDRNGANDLYAARVGGGFVLPEQPECRGDECQGASPGSPSPRQPGSTTVDGPGNVRGPSSVASRHRLLSIGAAARRALARRGRTTLRVRVARGGRVAVVARARLGGRRVRVGSASRVARRRGVVRLRLALSRRARAALSDGARLRVALTVTHSRSDRAVRRVVVVGG